MEYHKYLKYKSKYLQLKYKIESEAKSSRDENNEDSNIIVHARSPLRQNPPTYENEQTGGFTFKSGYYAFFCNSNHFKYEENGNAPSLSEINKTLSYKGYSLKLFTDRYFGKKQGTKYNLVISNSQSNNIYKKIQEFLNNNDEDYPDKPRKYNVDMKLITGIVGYPLFTVLWCITGSKINLFKKYEAWKKREEAIEGIAIQMEKEQNIDKKFKEKYFTEIIIVTQNINNKLPLITNVNNNTKTEIINNDSLNEFLNKELINLNNSSFKTILDAETDFGQLTKEKESLESKYQLTEEGKYRKNMCIRELKILSDLMVTPEYTTMKKNVDKYNKENIIDCCIIIKVNSGLKNTFLKKYQLPLLAPLLAQA